MQMQKFALFAYAYNEMDGKVCPIFNELYVP